MRAVKVSSLIAVVLLLGAAVFAWSGIFNVAADDPHWAITHRVLEAVRDRSIAVRARGIEVPALDDPKRIAIGAHEYEEMCTHCHLEPGDDDDEEELRAGLYPKPPDLARHGLHRSPQEQFWIVKHGLKMTGMPAWGVTHDDDTLWSIVAFLRVLPQMSEAEFDRLASAGSAANPGHHDDSGSSRDRSRGDDADDSHDDHPH
jgi:mono/diheme cytochrome c family protein